MSQASSDLDDFGGALEYEDQHQEEMPTVSAAPTWRKKGINIYTILLLISFLMLLTGAIRLFTQLGNY